MTPDNGEKYLIELSNSALTNIEGYQAEDAELTLTIDRADLEQVMMGVKSLAAQIEDGTATADGDLGVLDMSALSASKSFRSASYSSRETASSSGAWPRASIAPAPTMSDANPIHIVLGYIGELLSVLCLHAA